MQRAWGGVDLLCHCAGRSMRGNALATSVAEFRDLWETNFLSAVQCVQAFAEPLIESHGHIVLIGSLASKVAPRYLGAYPTSKFPLAALAQQLRMELGDRASRAVGVSRDRSPARTRTRTWADTSTGRSTFRPRHISRAAAPRCGQWIRSGLPEKILQATANSVGRSSSCLARRACCSRFHNCCRTLATGCSEDDAGLTRSREKDRFRASGGVYPPQ